MDTLVLLDELEEIEECTISDSKRKGGEERIECAIYFIKMLHARNLKFTNENACMLWAWPQVQSNTSMKMRADHNAQQAFMKNLA